jgi:hypothetical protein
MQDHLDVLIDFPELGTITVCDRAGRVRFYPCTDSDDFGVAAAVTAARRAFEMGADGSLEVNRVVEPAPGQRFAAPVLVR